ncbi:MAG: fused MFS/spermidine synthase [Acidobacteria bacterium]|nr:fused MFS/spermidine synthase [Acidobacteriota bacterium]
MPAGGVVLYAGAIFVSAFLLFQIQPIIAKVILPWFGGAANVWTTCMLFFQLVLLAGYGYSYWAIRCLSPKAQAAVHIALLFGALLLLPVTPHESWKPAGPEDPALRILGLLAATIGLPYFLLSTTSPLVHAWYARTHEGAIPYRLFALSNFSSMLALISYPVVVEPLLATRLQTQWWSAAYVAFVVLCGGAAVRGCHGVISASSRPPLSASADAAPPTRGLQLLWVTLAACASILLLSVTTHLSKNVAPIPFLWVLPLSLYLLSFILCFEGRGWYKQDWYLRLLLLAFAGMSYGLSRYGETASLPVVISIFAASLFVCCMVCHGELARLKPHPRYLTSFYLMCSLGGALGGVFVGLVAPYVFNASYELLIGMVSCAFLPVLVLYKYPSGGFTQTSKREAKWAVAGLAAALLAYLAIQVRSTIGESRVTVRNFYGVLRVIDSGDPGTLSASRNLSHGVINHGEQFLHPSRRRRPTTYYGPQSGASLALLQNRREAPQRVGVIGLGAGVLAAFGRHDDYYRFYEINPQVIELANSEFTFLKDCPAKTDVVLGDGRLALEREPSQQFDILLVDAFSGDSVPVHLLTLEAFILYFHHLKPGGVLTLNGSSTYLDLSPVVALAAKALGKEARLVTSEGDEKERLFAANWILATDRKEFFDQPALQAAAPIPNRRNLRLWTDDYSNLYRIIR